MLESTIDVAVLDPDATVCTMEYACELARQGKCASVCVKPCHVAAAVNRLVGDIPVSTVIGFPSGSITTSVKAYEAHEAIAAGATELDMVINIGLARAGMWDAVQRDIEAVTQIAQVSNVLVKVILETTCLLPWEIKGGCLVAERAGAQFVKTSTGFNGEGATEAAVKIMLDSCRLYVKASGGIKTREQAARFLELGCTRLGIGYRKMPQILRN